MEGIRTIGCICVFLCHFRLSFLPALSFWLIDNTPLQILTDGNTAVRVLFVLSGFVVSYKYFVGRKYEEVPRDILKRYFRLAPIVIAANVLAYLLMKAGFLYNIQAARISGSEHLGLYNGFAPDLLSCLKEAFITCFFQGSHAYVGPLWTMSYEYLGSILILAAIYICRESELLRYIFYFVFLGVFSSYYNYFVLGMFICDLYVVQGERDMNRSLQEHKALNAFLLTLGCIIVTMFKVNDEIKVTRILFAAGLVMLFMGLLNSVQVKKALGSRFMCLGGGLSYAVYAVHWPVMESFSSAYYLWMDEFGVNHYLSVASCLVLTILVTLFVAYIFSRYVEVVGKGAIAYITEKFMSI